MNTYLVLLRRMSQRSTRTDRTRLDAGVISAIARNAEVQLLNVLVTAGVFDGAIICRALSNQAIARFLDGLEGWHTDALLATRHVIFELDVQ